jgi:hypothetical protein
MNGVPFYSVPHFNTGRAATLNLIVVHHFAGASSPGSAAIQNWLRNPASRVSYHFGVDRDGRIRQWVDTRNTAWATGPVNARSIAIGCQGNSQSFTNAQRDAVVRIIRWARGAHRSIGTVASSIGGHRQFMQTACPGNPMFNALPELRRLSTASTGGGGGGTRHEANGNQSLQQVASSRNTRPQVIVNRSFAETRGLNDRNQLAMAQYLRGGATRTMPRGLVYWTGNPQPQGGRHEADGRTSLAQIARQRNTSVENLINQSVRPGRLNLRNRRALALYLTDGGGANARMPRGLVFWTVN